MSKERGEKSSASHRGKSAAKWRTTKRVGKHSQRGGSQREVRRTFKILREV